MMYLVDANVLSEPTKPVPSSKVIDWLTANERNLAVDSVIVGELCVGILSIRTDTSVRAGCLSATPAQISTTLSRASLVEAVANDVSDARHWAFPVRTPETPHYS